MLVIQNKHLVNLDNLFSMVIGGQGERWLICKGSGSLEIHLPFDSNPDAVMARNLIVVAQAEEKPYLYIDKAMDAKKELESAPKPKRKAGTSRK